MPDAIQVTLNAARADALAAAEAAMAELTALQADHEAKLAAAKVTRCRASMQLAGFSLFLPQT
jgi:hypothetical protein